MSPRLALLLLAVGACCGACGQRAASISCSVGTGDEIKCAASPAQAKTETHAVVRISAGGDCSVDQNQVACANVGATIRASHPSDSPRISLCPDRGAAADAASAAVKSIYDEGLRFAVECPDARSR